MGNWAAIGVGRGFCLLSKISGMSVLASAWTRLEMHSRDACLCTSQVRDGLLFAIVVKSFAHKAMREPVVK